MFSLEGLKIFFYTVPVDMRRSIDGLSIVVVEEVKLNPAGGNVYIFFNRQRDKIKILYWQQNGFCLLYKRLEKERFKVPRDVGILSITYQQLRWILDGLDYTVLQGYKALSYDIHA
jgi:transposase